jgi:hypothetical protein
MARASTTSGAPVEKAVQWAGLSMSSKTRLAPDFLVLPAVGGGVLVITRQELLASSQEAAPGRQKKHGVFPKPHLEKTSGRITARRNKKHS